MLDSKVSLAGPTITDSRCAVMGVSEGNGGEKIFESLMTLPPVDTSGMINRSPDERILPGQFPLGCKKRFIAISLLQRDIAIISSARLSAGEVGFGQVDGFPRA